MTRAELDERSKESILSDGFLGRFLLIDVTVSDKAIAFPLENTTELATAKSAIVRGLRAICEHPPKGCITGLFTMDAKIQRARWYTSELERIREMEKANERIGGAVRNHFARVQATCARVAMILSVASGRTTISKHDELLAEEMVGRSMRTIEELATSAAISDQDTFAQRVLEAVSLNGGMAVNDAIRGLRPIGMDWQKGEYVIRMLVNGGDVLLDQRATDDGPRNYLVRPGEAA